jgi:hypothetical protein
MSERGRAGRALAESRPKKQTLTRFDVFAFFVAAFYPYFSVCYIHTNTYGRNARYAFV